jgi:hypothetical protein
MKFCPLVVQLAALTLLIAPFVNAQEDTPVSGKVTTTQKTALKTAPKTSSAVVTMLAPNTDLRWVEGDQKGKYLRIMVPKGPSGWVLQSEVKKVVEPDFSAIAFAAAAQPCEKTLDACTKNRPTGCEKENSAIGLANKLKKTIPPEGAPTTLNFDTFSQLQSAALELVDQGADIEPTDRDKIKSIQTSAGTVGEGSRVRLMAFLSNSKKTPKANTNESVNCNIKGEANNDIHISVAESQDTSDFEGIVVEMIPQNRPTKWTVANVSKLRGKLLLIEGGLFYDNHHFVNGDATEPVPRQPPRFSLWEIHPVVSVKVCKKADNQCDPDRASDWEAFGGQMSPQN